MGRSDVRLVFSDYSGKAFHSVALKNCVTKYQVVLSIKGQKQCGHAVMPAVDGLPMRQAGVGSIPANLTILVLALRCG